jgi:hypothetical protein
VQLVVMVDADQHSVTAYMELRKRAPAAAHDVQEWIWTEHDVAQLTSGAARAPLSQNGCWQQQVPLA